MSALFSLRFPALAWAALFFAWAAHAATPVAENFPSAQGYVGQVVPVIPIAKALILPITAYDPDGNKLSFTATSSNPKFFVRVKTGNPLLRFTLQHTSDGSSSDPSYPAAGQSGDMVCQLFRNLTPQTVGYIAGFAQAGFYNNLTLHRLADLNAGVTTAGTAPSFIFQGGDPEGNGEGGPNFSFNNEQDASLIFAGRGQLAMANSGTSSTYNGTNGSQFFFTDGTVTLNADGTINTDGRPRFLDFGYTVFGQMTHGWSMLDSLRGTETWPELPSGETPPTGETPDLPKSPVSIVTAGISDLYQPDSTQTLAYTDAVLVLSATAAGTSNITVTMSDNETPPHTSAVTFAVEAQMDTINSKPFLSNFANQVVAKNKQINLPFQMTDLERDFVSLSPSISNNSTDSNGESIGFTGLVAAREVGVLGDPDYTNPDGSMGYIGELDLLLEATQFDMTYRGSIDGSPRAVDSYAPSVIAVGDPVVTLLPTVIQGTVGTALTGLAVAEYQSVNPQAQATDLTAVINWGDGTSTTNSSSGTAVATADFPADSIIPDPVASLSKFEVLGSHTYAAKGIYAVTVTFTGINGLSLQTISTAIISNGPLTAIGRTLEIKGRNTGNQVIATFTDSNGPAAAGSYLATIDWGDGLVAPGAVRANSSGVFTVSGSHGYVDPETFSILVHVHKQSDANLADDAIAWSTAKVTGFTGVQHLPPFNQAHLVAELTSIPLDPKNANLGTKPTKTIVGAQTYLSYEIIIVNSGNEPSTKGKLQVYLSDDKVLNTSPVYNADKTLAARADILLKIGPSHTDAIIPPLAPGAGVQFNFDKTSLGDFRLMPPVGETASGYNVLANLDYSDPIADLEPIQRAAIVGKVNGFIVSPTAVQTDEAGTPATFTVKLDKPPGQDLNGNEIGVTVPLAVSDSTVGTVVSPSGASLSFDNTNWSTPQTVTVAGVVPTTLSTTSQSFSVSVGPATSTGGILDEMVGPSVNATDQTITSNIVVSTATITTSDPNGPTASQTATFTVTLERQPTAPVTLQITAGQTTTTDLTEGLLSTAASPTPAASVTLTFNPADPTPRTQTVTVTGQSDGTVSGSATYSITFGAAVSTDPEFNNIQPAAISATNEHFAAP